jgi:hypothetical protein
MSTVATGLTNETQTAHDNLSTVKNLIDDGTFLKITAEYKLCKVLEREKNIYLKMAHRRVAYGLTVAEFEAVIAKLVSYGFCSTKDGDRGGVVISLVEHSSNLAREVSKPPVLRIDDPIETEAKQ